MIQRRYTGKPQSVMGQSFPVDVVKSKLISVGDDVLDHLVKLYLYPRAQEVNHWRREVAGKLRRTHKLSTTNKYPEDQWIYDILWGMYSDDLSNVVYTWLREYEDVADRLDILELGNMLDKFYGWISGVLSTDGQADGADIRQKLEEIGL